MSFCSEEVKKKLAFGNLMVLRLRLQQQTTKKLMKNVTFTPKLLRIDWLIDHWGISVSYSEQFVM